MRYLTQDDFNAVWPDSEKVQSQITGILAIQAEAFIKYKIDSILELAHLMAQISHESNTALEMTESLNYTPQALLKQWPTHFNTAQALLYGRTQEHPANQQMIGDLAYGGRMGNRPGTDDGYNFRGRGFIQTTGHNGYKELGDLIGLDLVNQPELVNDLEYAFICSVAEFANYPDMLDYCMADNLLAVSSLINLGHVVLDPSKIIGYHDREAWLRLWKHQLEVST